MPIRRMKVEKAAEIALKNRLYVSGWLLGEYLRSIKPERDDLLLYYVDERPVGVCFRRKYYKNSCLMVFVRKAYRYRGIGRKLVNKMKTNDCYGYIGREKGKGKIWKSNGIKAI